MAKTRSIAAVALLTFIAGGVIVGFLEYNFGRDDGRAKTLEFSLSLLEMKNDYNALVDHFNGMCAAFDKTCKDRSLDCYCDPGAQHVVTSTSINDPTILFVK